MTNDQSAFLPCCKLCKAPFNSVGAGFSVSYSEWMGWSGYDAPSYDNPYATEAIEYDEDSLSWNVCTPECPGATPKLQANAFADVSVVATAFGSRNYQQKEAA